MHVCLKTCFKVSFEVRLEVKSCPKDPEQWSSTVQIYPVGIEEKLTATVFLDCDCPCELSNAAVSSLNCLLSTACDICAKYLKDVDTSSLLVGETQTK